jgi:hypothetical protein
VKSYILRDIGDDLWALVRRRAETEGHTLRWILLKLLERYVKRGLD